MLILARSVYIKIFNACRRFVHQHKLRRKEVEENFAIRTGSSKLAASLVERSHARIDWYWKSIRRAEQMTKKSIGCKPNQNRPAQTYCTNSSRNHRRKHKGRLYSPHCVRSSKLMRQRNRKASTNWCPVWGFSCYLFSCYYYSSFLVCILVGKSMTPPRLSTS